MLMLSFIAFLFVCSASGSYLLSLDIFLKMEGVDTKPGKLWMMTGRASCLETLR